MNFGSIKDIQIKSPLDEMAQVRPAGSSRSIVSVVAPLMLTSLVDAFAVIVIYLLVSTTQGAKELDTKRDIKLPIAKQSKILEAGVSLRIVNNEYFIKEEIYTLPELLSELKTMSETFKSESDPREGNLIIQADKNSDYKSISPVLSVASQSGFEKIKFATLEE